MILNPATRCRFWVDTTSDVDPTDATLEVKVDAVWYPATWLAAATTETRIVAGVTMTFWRRPARTTDYFCGPDASPVGATVLAASTRHLTKTRLTLGGDQLVAESDPIDVQ